MSMDPSLEFGLEFNEAPVPLTDKAADEDRAAFAGREAYGVPPEQVQADPQASDKADKGLAQGAPSNYALARPPLGN